MIQIDVPMPKNCEECFCNYDMIFCNVSGERFDWDSFTERRMEKCPLREVDEESIVHCGDCRYKKRFRDIWGDEFFTEEILDSFVCIMLDKSVSENDYCHVGERKKE